MITIEKTVDISPDRRLHLDLTLPETVPSSKVSVVLVFPAADTSKSGIQEPPPSYMAEQTAAAPKGSLSERFAGALRLSDEKYAAFQNALQEGRSEWELKSCVLMTPRRTNRFLRTL